ncbi:hypothetical protein [Streptomyces globisporus]|nr:hypothetical protein OG449_15315 [Streptomyces globisporus]
MSQQWVEESYDEIDFTGCKEVYGRKSVNVELCVNKVNVATTKAD